MRIVDPVEFPNNALISFLFSILSVPKPYTLIPIIPDAQYLRGLTIREMKNALIQLRQTPPQDAVHHRVPQTLPPKRMLEGVPLYCKLWMLGAGYSEPYRSLCWTYLVGFAGLSWSYGTD